MPQSDPADTSRKLRDVTQPPRKATTEPTRRDDTPATHPPAVDDESKARAASDLRESQGDRTIHDQGRDANA